ncbi:hypothetical protein [Sulfobacillus harzensis]|uniref:Uncharacterized protein n=1 Tax=Sulfobacillus harzensis TaxID=2729629 RepID=A0A7Y0L666_9FIRM|nr:hypothetical protein [Sulfobacillus harzensis]NMP24053.1 hypothetical protein [Sulfobacillus harzensis]
MKGKELWIYWAFVALSLLWLAYLAGTWKGEARARAERDKMELKRRLFALEQAHREINNKGVQ